jgi:hypothetical protein
MHTNVTTESSEKNRGNMSPEQNSGGATGELFVKE